MVDNQHKQIKGYRDLSQDEIDMMNAVNMHGILIDEMIINLELRSDIDKRWLAIAKTDLQKGLMSLVRSIAKPESF